METIKLDDAKLRGELYRLGVTQVELARRAGLSRAVINNICRGISCTSATAEKIAAALGVPVEKLAKKAR